MDLLLNLSLGIGLSAACGYRVFVPLLGISIAALTGHIALPESFHWIGTEQAMVTLLAATALEIAAYYIPFVDNILDAIAAPAAFIAGTIVMATFISDLSPLLKWSLALIAGGGTAGIFQGTTTLMRGSSTTFTAGLGNFAFTTAETGISLLLTLFTFILPFIAGAVIIVLIFILVKVLITNRLRKSRGR